MVIFEAEHFLPTLEEIIYETGSVLHLHHQVIVSAFYMASLSKRVMYIA